jgi:hypothetical protein
MTHIQDLTQTIRETHNIETLAAATDVVQLHVDAIADDAELWDADGSTLTDAGVEVVSFAIAESYRQGLNGTAEDRLLDDIGAAAAAIAANEERGAELVAERDELIRAALKTTLRRADIAAAAGFKGPERLYQIRDGRR